MVKENFTNFPPSLQMGLWQGGICKKGAISGLLWVIVLGQKWILEILLCGRDQLILSDLITAKLGMSSKKKAFFQIELKSRRNRAE